MNKLSNNRMTANDPGSIKVLMQIRSNCFSHRGGDTVVLEKLADGLKRKGIDLTVDAEGSANPAEYDLVHLFNFATADATRAFAERAYNSGTPYVVTTLYEDVPSYRNQAMSYACFLMDYVSGGQEHAWYHNNKPPVSSIEPGRSFDNRWTAEHAAALFSNGQQESQVLRRDYPAVRKIIDIKLGHQIVAQGSAEDFVRSYGIRDFVLCVGRFEFRKNQLMLLKALEDSELPLVLVGGGFTYDPAYDRAVRQFKRKGTTLVLDRLSADMLASTYCAAKVHVLPSWYELPGLVSLEAANYGCRIVATDAGTTKDYFGNKAFYCHPADEQSVYNAILAAYYSPAVAGLQEMVRSYTWQKTVEETYQAYLNIVEVKKEITLKTTTSEPQVTSASAPVIGSGGYDFAAGITEFQEILDKGELAARNKEYNLAHDYLQRAELLNPSSVRALRARGAVFFAEGNAETAQTYFRRAYELDDSDPRTLSGLGMCAAYAKETQEAYDYFVQALRYDPEHLVTVLQLVECSYALNRYDDLIGFLRRYVDQKPEDLDIKYCLAGALYKSGDSDSAENIVGEILRESPNHLGARQLEAAIVEEKALSNRQPKGFDDSSQQKNQHENQETGPIIKERPAANLVSRLVELEELKHKREFAAVIQGCREIINDSSANDSDLEWAKLLQAEIKVLQGDFAAAQMDYDRMLEDNSKCTRALCGKGALAANAGSWQGARQFFQQALEIDPTYDVALAGLGLWSAWSEAPETAWDYYQRALDSNPENHRALIGVMELGYRMQKLEDVENRIKAYLELHPGDVEFIYSLAGCYYAQDKLDQAVREVGKITLLKPEHEKALELKELIDSRMRGDELTGLGGDR